MVVGLVVGVVAAGSFVTSSVTAGAVVTGAATIVGVSNAVSDDIAAGEE